MCVPWAKEKGYLNASVPVPGPAQPGQPPLPALVALCGMPEFKAAVLSDLEKLAKTEKLKGFEHIKNVFLSPVLMSVENGLMTPTFKIKRNEAAKVFKGEIEEMYVQIERGDVKGVVKPRL